MLVRICQDFLELITLHFSFLLKLRKIPVSSWCLVIEWIAVCCWWFWRPKLSEGCRMLRSTNKFMDVCYTLAGATLSSKCGWHERQALCSGRVQRTVPAHSGGFWSHSKSMELCVWNVYSTCAFWYGSCLEMEGVVRASRAVVTPAPSLVRYN